MLAKTVLGITTVVRNLFYSSNSSNQRTYLLNGGLTEAPRSLAIITHGDTDLLHQTISLKRYPGGKAEKFRLPSSRKETPPSGSNEKPSTIDSRDAPVNPPHVSALSIADPSVSRNWNGKLTLSTNANSITYSTNTGGKFVLEAGLTKIKVSELSAMMVTRVTPGKQIVDLSKGDEWDFSDTDDFFWVNGWRNSSFAACQEVIYFYLTGLVAPNADIIDSQGQDNPADLVRVGQAPSWLMNQVVAFPRSPFVPSVPSSVCKDFEEVVSYVQNVILNQPHIPISDGNELVKGAAFLPSPLLPPRTIKDFVNSIGRVDDVANSLFLNARSTPLMRNMLAVAMARLFQADTPHTTSILFAALLAFLYNWAIKIIQIDDYHSMQRVSFFLASLLDMAATPDYAGYQKEASGSKVLTTCFYLLLSQTYPFWEWTWNVSKEINNQFPLKPIVQQLINHSGNMDYAALFLIVSANFDDSVAMVPNVLKRIRSNCGEADLKNFAWKNVGYKVGLVDATLMAEKAQFAAAAKNSIRWFGMFRYSADMASGTEDVQTLKMLSSSMRQRSSHDRCDIARRLTYQYLLDPADSTTNDLIKWMTPDYSAYAADNLDSVHFKNSITRRGENQYQDTPCTNELAWLQGWLNAEWPSGQLLSIKCEKSCAQDYSLFDWNPANIVLNFSGHTCIAFGAPFEELVPSDLSTVVKFGSDCFAVQSQKDGALALYLAKINYSVANQRCVFHVRNGECKLLGSSDGAAGWAGSVPGAPGDFLLVLDDTPDIKKYPSWIAAALAGLTNPDAIKYSLSCFLRGSSDLILTIQ